MKRNVVVIGGGPAGLSCALWLKHLEYNPIVIERQPQLGGLQKLSPFVNKWYLGVYGQTGKELAQTLRHHAEREDIQILLGCRIKQILAGEHFQIRTPDHEISADAMVIATGQRVLGFETIEMIPGSHELLNSGKVCFNPGIIPTAEEQVVGVVGGGDNGLGTVIMLAETAKQVHLFVRSQLRGFPHNQKKNL